MNRGYIHLWRKILDTDIIKNHKLFAFWIWCLLKASHKEYTVTVGFQQVHLLPGQLLFGRKKAAEELGMSEQEIRTCSAYTKKTKKTTIKTTNKFSIISIVNWDTYHGNLQQDQPAHQPTTNQQLTTNNNIKTKNIYNGQFEIFYKAYPRKKNKKAALKAWMKNPEFSNGLFDTIMKAVEKQKASLEWKKDNGQYIPHPASWLNGARWEDEAGGSHQEKPGWI